LRSLFLLLLDSESLPIHARTHGEIEQRQYEENTRLVYRMVITLKKLITFIENKKKYEIK
jgi:hypothetical protein